MKIKINLLPPDKKNQLGSRRISHLIYRSGLRALLALCVFLVFLIFCLKLIQIQQSSMKNEMDRFNQNSTYRNVKEDQETLKKYHQKASALDKSIKEQKIYSALFKILNESSSEEISLTELKIENGALNLKGTAENRDSLLAFKEKIQQSQAFENIDFPVSNFVQSENVAFEINAKITKKVLENNGQK